MGQAQWGPNKNVLSKGASDPWDNLHETLPFNLRSKI